MSEDKTVADLLESWSKQIDGFVEEHAQRIWGFLSVEDELPEPKGNELLFVSGNWYDRGKANKLAELARHYSDARIVLAGGFGRLSSQRSEELGAEALEMREFLMNYGISPKRMVLYTGGRQTGDNIDFLLYWKKIIFENKKPRIISVDESYLVRRVRSTLLGYMSKHNEESIAVSVVSSGTKSYQDLTALHNDCSLITLHLMAVELDRLDTYSTIGSQPYLFSSSIAYGGVESFGGKKTILESARIIRDAHNFEQGRQIMNERKLALELFAPNYTNYP